VKPVPEAHVDAIRDHVSRQVCAMIELQRLTGMRPGEVVIMRTADLDTTGKLWSYTPQRHKTQHHGHDRTVYIGPKAQAVLAPWLRPNVGEYLFQPAEAEAERREKEHADRLKGGTPLTCGNVPGSNRKRRPGRKPSDRYTVDSYRRLLGIVEQDTFLFDGTIAQNIAYGRRGATPEEIERAARLANAHEFIAKLAGGYDTVIGERGVKLSGGQRQRITIARAILADPRILILDEATSNLDTESERLIQGSLQSLMAGRTSFVIAHRLSTVAHADRILVLENGRVVEHGRHEELMRASGRYREMVDLQTSPPPMTVTEDEAEPERAFARPPG